VNKTWAIVVAVVIIGVSVAIFGFSNDTQSKVSDIEANDIKSQRVTTTLTPEIITIESTSQVISSEDYMGEVTTDQIQTQSFLPELNFKPAYGVSSTQSSISVTTWFGSDGSSTGFDTEWNQFSTGIGSTKIVFINVTDNSKKTWTLPNDDKAFSRSMGVDSNGDLFFGKADVSGSNDKLAKLSTSTNVFTEYIANKALAVKFVIIDSSDNVFFISGGDLYKLVPSTNLLTKWINVGGSQSFHLGTSGNLYFAGDDQAVATLDINTNTFTKWTIPSAVQNLSSITSDSSGDIFFTFTDGIRSKVGKITISDNTLTEWIIPNSDTGSGGKIAVDSEGNVFVARGLTRLVPSTDTFTIFNTVCTGALEIDSSDDIHCAGSDRFSKIT